MKAAITLLQSSGNSLPSKVVLLQISNDISANQYLVLHTSAIN